MKLLVVLQKPRANTKDCKNKTQRMHKYYALCTLMYGSFLFVAICKNLFFYVYPSSYFVAATSFGHFSLCYTVSKTVLLLCQQPPALGTIQYCCWVFLLYSEFSFNADSHHQVRSKIFVLIFEEFVIFVATEKIV